MSSKFVIDSVKARLVANWTTTPIIDPNTTGLVPIDRSPFLVHEYPISQEDQITLGASGGRIFREHGAFWIGLMIPLGAGLSPYDQQIDDLRSVFRVAVFGTPAAGQGYVNTFAPGPPTQHDASDKGAYFALSFSVPYYWDRVG